MKPLETDWIYISDLIRRGGYDASLITTFNAYLPFYEEIVLRHLLSAGCRHNILLMDKSQFSECLESEDLRPHNAGFDYTLIPMHAKGAFHPKIVLLVGKRKGILLVGSHNVTLSGWGLNKELTTKIEISDGKEKNGIPEAIAAWQFIMNWISYQKDLPTSIQNSLKAIARIAPWLNFQPAQSSQSFSFYGSKPIGLSLWDQIKTRLSVPVKRVSIIGPFFDQSLDFIKTIQTDLNPQDIVIGIEPETVHISLDILPDNNIHFVDATSIILKNGYLHAKAIFIESSDGKNFLITGSANPSQPAWTDNKDRKNAEAIIFHDADVADSVAESIGIKDLTIFPDVPIETFQDISKRIAEVKNSKKESEKTKRMAIAVLNENEIKLDQSILSFQIFKKAFCKDHDHRIIYTIDSCLKADDAIHLRVPEKIAAHIRFVEIETNDDKSLIIMVHHNDVVMKKTISSRQIQFRRSLASLQSDNPDIENVIAAVEKIIFEQQVDINPDVRIKSGKSNKTSETQETEVIETLGVHYNETKRAKRKQRMLASGDLAYLIDVLIHHLGQDFQKFEKNETDDKGRNEEEQRGADDDDETNEVETKSIEIDTPTLVKICNGKVRRLIKRLISNFEKAHEQQENYSACLMKLYAVLALLRELKSFDFRIPKVPFQKSFFPEKDRDHLLSESIKFLYGRSYQFWEKSKTELIDYQIDEISRLKGLLLWLANECGADFRDKRLFRESSEAHERDKHKQSYLLFIASDAAWDDVAIEEAYNCIELTTQTSKKVDGRLWISSHKEIGKKISKFQKKAHKKSHEIINKARIGNMAFVRDQVNPTFHIVLKTGKELILTDVEIGQRVYSAEKIAALNLPNK